jgi:hypothetical protein
MKARQQSSTGYPIPFLLVSSTDHVTPVTGAGPTVNISKNGGAFAAAAGVVTEVGNGWYQLAGHAGDRSTLGVLLIQATATGADPANDSYDVVPWNPFDASLGLANLDAPVSSRSIYAGADTPGTTTLVGRLTALRAANLDNLALAPPTTLQISAAVADQPLAGHTLAGTIGAALNAGSPAAIADQMLQRNLAGGLNGGRTVRDALRIHRNKVVIDPAAGTITVYAEDDSTVAWSGTLTTDATAAPITGVDPL